MAWRSHNAQPRPDWSRLDARVVLPACLRAQRETPTAPPRVPLPPSGSSRCPYHGPASDAKKSQKRSCVSATTPEPGSAPSSHARKRRRAPRRQRRSLTEPRPALQGALAPWLEVAARSSGRTRSCRLRASQSTRPAEVQPPVSLQAERPGRARSPSTKPLNSSTRLRALTPCCAKPERAITNNSG